MWRTSKGGGLLENRGQQWNNMEKKSRKMRRERAKRRGRKNWNAHRKDAQVLARHMQGHADGRGGWRGGGAQVTSPSHPSTSIYVDGDGLSGEWAAPVHLGHPPLIPFLFPPSASTCFFSFPHPNHADAVTWTKLSPDPLRGFSFPLLRSYSSMKYSSGSIDSQRSTFDTTRFKAYTLYSENTITGLIAIKQRSHPFNYRIYFIYFFNFWLHFSFFLLFAFRKVFFFPLKTHLCVFVCVLCKEIV